MAKARKSGFKYRGSDRTVESVARRSKQAGGAYDSYLQSSLTMYKVKEGENCVRILPPTWDDTEAWGDSWEIGIHIHYDVGPDKGAYLCLDKMRGEPCAVCDVRRDAADGDEADALRPGWRALCWVIDRDNEKAGPQVWSMPITIFREINLRSIDKKSNLPILVDHPEEGFDIIFSREGTGLRTKYSAIEIDRDPTPLHEDEDVQDRWLDYVSDHPLPDVLQFYESAHIEKVLFGRAERRSDEDEDDQEDQEERRSEGRRRSSRRSRQAQEDEPEVDEDEEEETPRRSRRRSRKIEEELDDDIPFDEASEESEDEEEEEPRRRRRSSRRRAVVDEEDEGDEDAPSDDDEEDGESASESARESLGRMRRRRGKK
jgi:hypothetical protein